MNADDNVDNKEDYGSIGSYFKISPTVIDDYTKKKYLNMQLENLRPKRILKIMTNKPMKYIRNILFITKNLVKEVR